MNFTRIFLVDIALALTAQGIGSWLIDLPGTGESLRSLHEIGWEDWRDAVRVAGETIALRCGRKPHVVAVRGGALLADAVDGRSCWSLAAVAGTSLLRDLRRVQIVSDARNNRQDPGGAGYLLSAAMEEGLSAAVAPALTGSHRVAPPELYGSHGLLWRRAEPARDQGLSAALAEDIAAWITSCEHR